MSDALSRNLNFPIWLKQENTLHAGVDNDPLSHPTFPLAIKFCVVYLYFEKWGPSDVSLPVMIVGRPCGSNL